MWSIVADRDGSCRSSEEDFAFEPVAVSEAVRGMVLSDTLFGAGSGRRRGPLGRLARSVHGGVVEGITAGGLAAVCAAYPELPVARNPFSV